MFGKKCKFSPRYIRPFKLSKRMGNVYYDSKLPQEFATVHLVFQIFVFKKCMGDPCFFIQSENIEIKGNLTCEEILVEILD